MKVNINPVLWLELRVRVREKRLWIMSLAFMLLLFGLSLFPVLMNRNYSDLPPAEIGKLIKTNTMETLLGLLLIISSMSTAGRISLDRERHTLTSYLNTTLTRATIVWGKLLASWIYILWLTSLSLPSLFFAALWGGFPPEQTIAARILIILASMATSSLALGISGFFRHTLTSYLVNGAVLLLWLVIWPIVGVLVHSLAVPTGYEEQANFEMVLDYVFNLPHPLVVLTSMLGEAQNISHVGIIPPLLWALLIWSCVGVFGFWLALRSLKKPFFLIERAAASENT